MSVIFPLCSFYQIPSILIKYLGSTHQIFVDWLLYLLSFQWLQLDCSRRLLKWFAFKIISFPFVTIFIRIHMALTIWKNMVTKNVAVVLSIDPKIKSSGKALIVGKTSVSNFIRTSCPLPAKTGNVFSPSLSLPLPPPPHIQDEQLTL